MVRGHTHNRLDQANSTPRQNYYKAEVITSGKELARVLVSSNRRYSANLFWPIRDFKAIFDELIDSSVKVCFLYIIYNYDLYIILYIILYLYNDNN